MIKELDVVTLTRDVQKPHLSKESRGAVVHCYSDGQGFEIEFVRETGEAIAVLTLGRADIQPECRDDSSAGFSDPQCFTGRVVGRSARLC